MLISITEHNSWENERWTYVLDLSKQDGETINQLMIFIRLANEHWATANESAPVPNRSSIFARHTPKLFAASKYWIKFYEACEKEEGGYVLRNKNGNGLHIRSGGRHKSNRVLLDAVMSSKRMHSAVISIRDKDKNILYKDFDSLFLKKRATA